MLFIGIIVAITIFLFFNNKQQNRAIDRRNRLAEKQEELIEMLRKKNSEETENKENKENE
ncbi:MAG: hypothetical protein WDM90_22335 [Ferruginibacter sp.]